jgi:hypothetical protein
MKWIAFALFATLAANTADAATRSYFTPMDEGQRIGACLSDGISCGKVAADAFCKSQGFSESILFAREPVMTARSIDTGQLCAGETCQAFKRVKCFQSQEQAAQQPAAQIQ